MANSVDPEQTAPIGTVCSGSTLFSSILNLSVMLGNYLQQTTSADDIFRCISFLGALRVKMCMTIYSQYDINVLWQSTNLYRRRILQLWADVEEDCCENMSKN